MNPAGLSAYYLNFCSVEPSNTFWTSESGGVIKLPTPIIEGESMVKGHEKEVQLGVWSHGGTQPVAADLGGGQSIGRASFSDFTISLPGQVASTKLLQHMCQGKLIKAAIVSAERTATQQSAGSTDAPGTKGPQIYAMWVFHNLMVSSYSDSGVAAGGMPMQHITLRAASIRTLHRQFDVKTGQPKGWDVQYWDIRGNTSRIS